MHKLFAAIATALFALSAPAFAADAKKEEKKDAKKVEAKKEEKKEEKKENNVKGGC
jgi:ribosomal protein L12E/L44/L45/RPP1/RPP2